MKNQFEATFYEWLITAGDKMYLAYVWLLEGDVVLKTRGSSSLIRFKKRTSFMPRTRIILKDSLESLLLEAKGMVWRQQV